MNHYVPNANPQPCPVCGAEPHYRTWSNFVGTNNTTNVASAKHHIYGSPLFLLVCTQCGYVQLFVNAEDFRKEPQQ